MTEDHVTLCVELHALFSALRCMCIERPLVPDRKQQLHILTWLFRTQRQITASTFHAISQKLVPWKEQPAENRVAFLDELTSKSPWFFLLPDDYEFEDIEEIRKRHGFKHTTRRTVGKNVLLVACLRVHTRPRLHRMQLSATAKQITMNQPSLLGQMLPWLQPRTLSHRKLRSCSSSPSPTFSHSAHMRVYEISPAFLRESTETMVQCASWTCIAAKRHVTHIIVGRIQIMHIAATSSENFGGVRERVCACPHRWFVYAHGHVPASWEAEKTSLEIFAYTSCPMDAHFPWMKQPPKKT